MPDTKTIDRTYADRLHTMRETCNPHSLEARSIGHIRDLLIDAGFNETARLWDEILGLDPKSLADAAADARTAMPNR